MREWNYENEQWIKLPSHLRHLPLFTRHLDWASILIRWLWACFLKFILFKFYIRLEVKGSFVDLYKKNPRLLIISNHSSHLDAISIAAAIPFKYWLNLYVAAAKDYFFSNFWMSFFSKHCIGAIPIERKGKTSEAVRLCINLLSGLRHIWIVFFPEGTRSPDGQVHPFKKGVSIFSIKSDTPILFLYLQGAYNLWPKGASFARPGHLTVHVGPVHKPSSVKELNQAYKDWVDTIEPNKFAQDPHSLQKQSQDE